MTGISYYSVLCKLIYYVKQKYKVRQRQIKKMCDKSSNNQLQNQIFYGWVTVSCSDVDPSVDRRSFILSHEEAVFPDGEDGGCLDHGSKLTD